MKLLSSRLSTPIAIVFSSTFALGLLGSPTSSQAQIGNRIFVINTNDSGAGSLRQAILDANTAAGADEVIFRLPGNGMKTITLTSGQLDISGQLMINGLGRNQITISGNNSSRVFQVNSGANVILRGVTIVAAKHAGDPISGGAILNLGKLDIRNSTFSRNSASTGGAISKQRKLWWYHFQLQ
jgi:hypothetical protein